MNAKINLPEQPKMFERLPIYFKIELAAMFKPWEVQLIYAATDYFNDLAPMLGVTKVFQEDILAPLIVITRDPYPQKPERWGTAFYPDGHKWPIRRVESCTLALHPRWFESRWGARKENLVRHELAHFLGFGHTTSFFSLLNPTYCTGWWPWRLPLFPKERNELTRYWRP